MQVHEFVDEGLGHSSYLVVVDGSRVGGRSTPIPRDGDPVGLFSGGSLMVGTVGRTDVRGPDLAEPLA